ncbi:ABC transporter ATP-binding protein [Anditalea andensis]|uniref:ABC transporter n=1 Tax=Anditalea andensis TaxID=1048983 RepID=A0A074KYB1_9BACT|nr:ABC transporter ATP-binding protein [Anditalea andensis]KEO73180.1 ABC transporter [Anditalea andensis]
MTILELQSIDKKYSQADYFAVNQVSFKVKQGEILALVGESGSGKTTLLRLIAGLEHPNSGCILLSGEKIAERNKSVPSEKRKVGMVFQDYALFPHLSIIENVKFGLIHTKGDKDKIAKETLDLVGLKENYSKYPHQLSGGQQQRVALARAIAPRPFILLMDEPFSNLDALLKDQVREEIRQIIKKTGVTAIFVTHDTRDALSTADRIAILHKGRLQQIDLPRNLYEKPINPYVANFFGKRNEILATATVEGFYTSFGFIEDENAKNYQDKVRLFFRPEHASLTVRAGQALSGKLFKVSYYGDHQILKLTDEEGKKISIKINPTQSVQNDARVHFSLHSYGIESAY